MLGGVLCGTANTLGTTPAHQSFVKQPRFPKKFKRNDDKVTIPKILRSTN